MSEHRVPRSSFPWRRWLSGLLIAAVLVFAMLHVRDLEQFAVVLRRARPAWLLPAVLFQAATYVAVAAGWRAVLQKAGQDRPLGSLTRIAITKLFADQAIPSGGVSGNILLVDQLIAQGVGRGAASAALIVSIVGYYIAGALCAGTTFALLWVHHAASVAAASVLAVFLGLAVGIPWLALWLGGRAGRQAARHLRRVAWLARMFDTITAAPSDLLKDCWLIVRVTLCNLAVCIADMLTLWVCLGALGLDVAPWKAFVALIMATIVAAIGPIPMGLGSFEATSTAMLHGLGVPTGTAFAATMLLRLFTLWLPLVPGLVLIRRTDRHRSEPAA